MSGVKTDDEIESNESSGGAITENDSKEQRE